MKVDEQDWIWTVVGEGYKLIQREALVTIEEEEYLGSLGKSGAGYVISRTRGAARVEEKVEQRCRQRLRLLLEVAMVFLQKCTLN